MAIAHEQTIAMQINGDPGYKKYWNLNRQGLKAWGLTDLVQAVDAAVLAESPQVGESPLSKV